MGPVLDGAPALTGVTRDGDRWSNAAEDRVELVDHDPRWPAMFEAEAGQLQAALAGRDLKRALQARHPTDRDAYTAGKEAFVAEILRRAGAAPP